jgi:hypothetical protein
VSKDITTTVDLVIRIQVVGTPADVANCRSALECLADVMAVQAEDGLWSLGHEDAENDDGPSEPIANITSTHVHAVLIDGVDELTKGDAMSNSRTGAWGKLADYYKRLAAERADEGTSIQLACLVLAEHCAHQWMGDRGGPTPDMVALAENTAGEYLDEKIAAELAKAGEI